MNLAVLLRLRLIDILLEHYGTLNRAVLMEQFGLSVAQVSHDIAEYLKLYPTNMVYDKSKRVYVRLETFRRQIS